MSVAITIAIGPVHSSNVSVRGPLLTHRGLVAERRDSALFPFQVDERADDEDPVEDVGEDGAECGGVVPPEQAGPSDQHEFWRLQGREEAYALKSCHPPLVVGDPDWQKSSAPALMRSNPTRPSVLQ